jgi:hypothetical protein
MGGGSFAGASPNVIIAVLGRFLGRSIGLVNPR